MFGLGEGVVAGERISGVLPGSWATGCSAVGGAVRAGTWGEGSGIAARGDGSSITARGVTPAGDPPPSPDGGFATIRSGLAVRSLPHHRHLMAASWISSAQYGHRFTRGFNHRYPRDFTEGPE